MYLLTYMFMKVYHTIKLMPIAIFSYLRSLCTRMLLDFLYRVKSSSHPTLSAKRCL